MKTHDQHEDFVRNALEDAVAGIEPADRLDAIRARTATSATRTRGWLAAGAVSVAAAAAVMAAVVITTGDDARGPDVAGQPTKAPTVYYIGPGPDGPEAPDEVLYPQRAATPVDPLTGLMTPPEDPDYRTAWAAGSLVSWRYDENRILVRVAGGPVNDEKARQQLAWTMRATAGRDLPVQLERTGGGEPIRPIEAAPEMAAVSHMSIAAPAEGSSYGARSTFTAHGRANGFEGTVFCQILDAGGNAVWQDSTVNGGLLDETINPWKLKVDLSTVEPGEYTFRCQTDDPTAGTSGRGADIDTRSITVNRS